MEVKVSAKSLTRRSLLKSVAAAGGAGIAGGLLPGARAAARPNILLVITDQQSSRMLSAAGNPWLRTPAMDSLAHSGVRFAQAYAANPVCLPSRFAMFTGKYPSAVGVRHNGSKPSAAVNDFPQRALGHIMRRAGYETAYGGKVHLPGPMARIRECGFDTVVTPNQREELARLSVDYLHKPHSKPFFLVTSFINPHDICYMAIRDYAESLKGAAAAENPDGRIALHAPKELDEALAMPPGISEKDFFVHRCPPLPANFEIPKEEPDAIEWLVKERPFREHARRTWNAERWRRHRWAYCRLTERVDGQIHQVLSALDDTGLAGNTVVIFLADHGDHDSAHRLEHKTTFYEESARVPLIVRDPAAHRAGVVVEDVLASTGLDVFPTVCDYGGVEPPAGLQGRSLRPSVEGKPPARQRPTLLVESEIGYMVTDGRYKYAAFDPDKGKRRESLVDLETDPGEMHNLAAHSGHRSHLLRLRAAMADWQRQNGVSFEMPV